MADAVRNVTIVMNIQPGDMSAVKAAIKELNEMKGIYEDVGASVQKLNAEQQSLGKTQAETARQERELIILKKEEVAIEQKATRDQIENTKKRVEEEQRIETEHVAKIERIRRPLREPRSVRPLREPDGSVPFLVGGGGGPVKPPETDLSEFSKDIEKKIDKDYAEFEKKEKKKTEVAKREAEKRAREADEAMQEMPKHWRNVGLNAGQSVASVARYISHMRMLKQIGGESLDDIAKKLMTVHARLETISASTSFFTNFGTMVDGLRTAGEATEKIVRQQQILGKETTLSQFATMRLGKEVAAIAPFIAPLQFGFTAITAAIVGADLAMDFFGESFKSVKELSQSFDQSQAKVVEKLREQNQLLNDQTGILSTQWELRKLMAGDVGLNTSDLKKKQEQERKQREMQAEAKLAEQSEEIFKNNLSDEKKAERQRVEDEIKRRKDIVKDLESLDPRTDAMPELTKVQLQGEKARIAQLEKERDRLNIEARAGIETRLSFKDGSVQGLANILKEAGSLPAKERNAWLTTIGTEVAASGQLLARQQSEARQKAMEEENRARKSKDEADTARRQLEDEKALAAVYGLEDSKFRLNDVTTYLQDFSRAGTDDERARAIRDMQNVLQGGQGQESLMTPELQRELSKGATASPDKIDALIKDASVFDEGERVMYEGAIAKAEKALTTAQSQAEATSRLIDAIEKQVQMNEQELEQIRRAIENRDLN